MADANSSTPPPEQEQPTRPASFDPKWNQTDASFLHPSALPRPKAPRAWERQPHSPFARNGKYRKVWKRYELRSQPQTKDSAAATEKKSAMVSPRKIVKKRALDAPADPNATPGRKGPKNKAFAPTRWETPRRHSGRIASRKIAPPMFMEKPSPKPTRVDAVSTTAEYHSSESSDAEDPLDDIQTHRLIEPAQDEATVEANEGFSVVEDLISQPEDAREQLAINLSTRITSPQALAVEQGAEPETAEKSDRARPDVEAPDANDTSPITNDIEERAMHDGIWAAGVHSEPESGQTDAGPVESSSSNEMKENEVGIPKDENDTITIPVSLFQESHAIAMEVEHAEVDDSSAVEDPAVPQIPETQWPEISVADVNESEEPATTSPEHVKAISETSVDTIMEGQEEQSTGGSQTEDSRAETKAAAQEEEQPTNLEQLLQADAAQALSSDSGLEDDEVSVADEEMDETEHLDEDGFTLTELPEADGEDATSIPSPSLSAAESPRFSAIADTLTLNLPDRTPPKNRTTKDIPEESASPVDEDTAFLREFLSRADASKASREAITPRLESMTNRRDSDIVRQALASPRIALERKDPNSPSMANVASPTRKGKSKESERASDTTALDGKKLDFSDITEDLTLEKPAPAPAESSETTSNSQNTRRSSRARQTRLPATPSASNAGPNRIQFRRADGTDPVVLKKTEAQELANLTRNNTRRNKGTALAAPIRLNKLKAESLKAGASPGAPSPNGPVPIYANPEIEVYQASKLRWDQQLVYFQEQDNLAGLTSLSDDELAGLAETPVQEPAGKEDRKRKDKSSTSTPARTKRARGLGAGNGTPAKGLLAPASLLPAEVQAETLETESSKTSGKKPSSASTKSSASTRARKADKPTPTPPAPTAPSPSDGSSSSSKIPSPSSSAEQPSSSNAPPPPMETGTAQPAPSQLSTPSSIGQSRRSRLQTPRKVKLPVPVPVSAAAAAASTPGPTAPAAAQTQAQSASRIIGLTPKKMPVAKPAGSTGGPEVSGGGNGGQGLSAGRRRAGAGRRP